MKIVAVKKNMRFILLFFISSLISAVAHAQYVRLLTATGVPAAGVDVTLQSVSKPEVILRTDKEGKATLPVDGYPYIILVRSLKYEAIKDSLPVAEDKTIWLYTRELQINDVVVTGQYRPVSNDNAVQRVEVIDRKKINAMAAQNLRDVLTNQLEIRITNDAIFGASMNMQGSGAYGADAKILIDGVPVVGKQNGAVDLTQINLANIERIEIIKGPMSVSYGTDAIAGTVNLITRKTVKKSIETSAAAYYETIGTYNVTARVGIHKNKHSLTLDGFRNFFGGWRPDVSPQLFDFSSQLADTNRNMLWKPREQYQGGLQYQYKLKNITFNYKGNYFYELITNRGTPLMPYREFAFDNYFHTYRIDNALFINADIATNKHINFLAAYNAYKRVKNESARNLTNLTETFNDDLQDTSLYNEFNSRATFAGTGTGNLSYEVGYDINIQQANSTLMLDRKQDMGNFAFFASAEYKLAPNLTLRPGLRYAYNTRYNAPVVPSLNLMYKPTSTFIIRTSYARGFRQPGLKELYFDFVDINHNIQGNTDLKAEYSDNFSGSLTYSGNLFSGHYSLNTALYYNDIHDLIMLVMQQGGAANEYFYSNASRFRTMGVQFGADYSIRNLSLSVGGAYIGTYNYLSETNAIPGFSYSPEVRSSITYALPKFGLSTALFYKYTGRFIAYVLATDNTVTQSFMNSYHIADITLSKQFFSRKFIVSLGCKNLFDVRNVATNRTGGAHTGSATSSAVGTGRYYFLKTEINFSR
jgi:outer membrane receptor for ferrienterochelin and colicins